MDSVAHEIGHLLGLNDSGCGNQIMSPLRINNGVYVDRSVRPEECTKVADTNKTPWEQQQEQCMANPSMCSDPPDCVYQGTCSPIMIDLAGDGFALSGARNGVLFDIDADGEVERCAWPQRPRTSRDVFLALDRDGSGGIESGAELFGDHTVLQDGSLADNGFIALWDIDANGNGWLTPDDPAFSSLRVWWDVNRDGISQASELTPLLSHGIYALDLNAALSLMQDAHGNRLRWWSRALQQTTSGYRALDMVDIYLVTIQPEANESD